MSPGTTFLRVSLPLVSIGFMNQAMRAVTAVIGPDIAAEFGLSASDLGVLAAVLFVAYAAAQIPVGIMLDRHGARRVQAALALSIAAGAATFALAPGFLALAFGRVLIGVGIAAALMALLKAHAQWLPRERSAAVNGWCVGLGGLGGIAATLPVQWAMAFVSWRGVFWGVAALAVASSLWIGLTIPERPRPDGPRHSLLQETRVAFGVFADRTFWRYVPAVAFLSAMNFTYQGLWAGPWLRDVGGFDGTGRAAVLLVYGVGMVAGSFTLGTVVSALQKRGVQPIIPVIGMMLALLAVQVLLALGLAGLSFVLWPAFAFFGSAGVVGYTIMGHHYPPSMTGRISTAINLCMLVMVFTFQTLIGLILDLYPRTASGGWDPMGYSAALWMTVAAQSLAIAWLLLPRRGEQSLAKS